MKATFDQLLSGQEAFDNLSKITSLAANIRVRLARISAQVNTCLKEFQDTRLELIKKFGAEKPDGNWEVKPENLKAFSEEWKDLVQEEVEINGKQIPFEAISQAPISAGDLWRLGWLIALPKEEEEDAPKAQAASGD
jgi:hypothetical protein